MKQAPPDNHVLTLLAILIVISLFSAFVASATPSWLSAWFGVFSFMVLGLIAYIFNLWTRA